MKQSKMYKRRDIFLSEKAELHVALDAARQDGLSQQLEQIILDVVRLEEVALLGIQVRVVKDAQLCLV
eukprot:m.25610 g.25610  ORF g.25610 m.25610 type:complete len:68 (-) comp9786_c0_seq1:3726-3929(-)